MFRLIIFLCCIVFCSCQTKKGSNESQVKAAYENDSIKLFSTIEKDSAYFINFQFSKQVNSSGVATYVYNNNNEKGFVILCDTGSKIFKLVANTKDTSNLLAESERIYTVNGKNYKVLKLVLDKGVTDGEVSYFFNIEFGLLLSKSNTWRIGKVLSDEKSNSQHLQITTLLFKIFTDDEFYRNPTPQPKIKFTPPKVK